jgi:ABC-type uncharacterized transport system ATPase subunit
VLAANGLAKRFGDVVALDGCSLAARRGRVLGFLGANGAGKTRRLDEVGLAERNSLTSPACSAASRWRCSRH